MTFFFLIISNFNFTNYLKKIAKLKLQKYFRILILRFFLIRETKIPFFFPIRLRLYYGVCNGLYVSNLLNDIISLIHYNNNKESNKRKKNIASFSCALKSILMYLVWEGKKFKEDLICHNNTYINITMYFQLRLYSATIRIVHCSKLEKIL